MQSGPRLERSFWIVCIPLGIAVYLYFNLFAFPRTPFLLNGDQAFFWMDAQRMLNGEHVYQDFFQFTPPGTDGLSGIVQSVWSLRLGDQCDGLRAGSGFVWGVFLTRERDSGTPTRSSGDFSISSSHLR